MSKYIYLVIVAVVVGAVVGASTYVLTPSEGGGVSKSKYNELKSSYEDLQEKYEAKDTVPKSELPGELIAGQIQSRPRDMDPMDFRWLEREFIDGDKFEKEPPFTIGVSLAWRGNPFDETWIRTMKEYAKSSWLIDELVFKNASADATQQKSDIRDLNSREDIDAILVNAISATAVSSTIEEVYESGTPIAIDKCIVDTDKYAIYVSSDSFLFGKQSAQWLVNYLHEHYPDKDEFGLLCLRGVKGMGPEINRWEGAKSVFDQYDDIKVLDAQYGNWNMAKGKEIGRDMIRAHPNFDAVWSMGGQMSAGMIDAMVEAGLDPGDYPHASEDFNAFFKRTRKYDIPAAASSMPNWMGMYTLQQLEYLLMGNPVQRNHVLCSEVVTPEEASEYAGMSEMIWSTTVLPKSILEEMWGTE